MKYEDIVNIVKYVLANHDSKEYITVILPSYAFSVQLNHISGIEVLIDSLYIYCTDKCFIRCSFDKIEIIRLVKSQRDIKEYK